MNEQKFVFCEETVPAWFNKQANQGRVKTIYDDNHNIVSAKIFSGVNIYEAFPGDTIINSKSGLVVIAKPVVKAKPVQASKKNNNKEEK